MQGVLFDQSTMKSIPPGITPRVTTTTDARAPTYPNPNAGRTSTSTTTLNGVTYAITSTVGATTTSGGTSTSTPHGIWVPSIQTNLFSMMRCPSDSSVPKWRARVGLGPFQLRGELERVQSQHRRRHDDLRRLEPAQRFVHAGHGLLVAGRLLTSITDGLSNTVMFAEAYALCEGTARIALYSAGHDNFGITPGFSNIKRHQYGRPHS